MSTLRRVLQKDLRRREPHGDTKFLPVLPELRPAGKKRLPLCLCGSTLFFATASKKADKDTKDKRGQRKRDPFLLVENLWLCFFFWLSYQSTYSRAITGYSNVTTLPVTVPSVRINSLSSPKSSKGALPSSASIFVLRASSRLNRGRFICLANSLAAMIISA